MIVKRNEKQLSFLFQAKDSYFEIGYLILEQAALSGMLPYKRARVNEKEKLIFNVEHFSRLSDRLPYLDENEIVDLLYAVVFMTQKVEENGFMKRECIWCKYDDIYYDEDAHKPLFAVLPITQEFRYADGASWQKGYEECLLRIADFLPEKKKEQMKKFIALQSTGIMHTPELLEKIDALGNGTSGLLVDRTEEIPNSKLELVYSGKEGTFAFSIEEEDFIIGRSKEETDGVLQMSNRISRKHCLITKINRNYFVQDLDSANGTYVNGTSIPPYELMQLEHNDVLRLADVDLRVRMI